MPESLEMNDILFSYLKKCRKPVSAMELLSEIGLANANENICQRILEGIIADDSRFTFSPRSGWTISKNGQYVATKEPSVSEREEELYEKRVRTADKRSLVILAARVAANMSPFHSPIQLSAELIVDQVPVEKFGPIVFLPDSELNVPIQSEYITLSISQGIQSFRKFLGKSILVTWHAHQLTQMLDVICVNHGLGNFQPLVLSLKELSSFLLSDKIIEDQEKYAHLFSANNADNFSIETLLEQQVELYFQLNEIIQGQFGIEPFDWLLWQHYLREKENFFNLSLNDSFFLELPELPGIYQMFDQAGSLLYVGKSKNLKSRLISYFMMKTERAAKEKSMLQLVHAIDIQLCGSDLDAEILEAETILETTPPFNVKIEFTMDVEKDISDGFVILPGIMENERIIHTINERSEYNRISVTAGLEDIDAIVAQLEDFFEKDLSKAMNTETQQSDVRRYRPVIFKRWLKGNRELYPFYSYNKMTVIDMKKIIAAVLSDSFEPEVSYC